MKKINCAGVIFITSDNNILLEDRRRIKKHGEHWSFFGGSVEKGETHEETMKREIIEETGIDIKDYQYFKKYTFIPKNNHNLELTYYMYIAKAPDINTFKIHEKGGFKVFTLKEALNLKITEKDKEIIRDVMNYLNQNMTYHLVAIPQEKDLKILNKLRNHVYKNNFRFKNKPLSSDTHITLTEVNIKEEDIEKLEKILKKNISKLKPFSLNKKEWILTKEEIEFNYKKDRPYTWIALKFEQRKDLFETLEKITKELGVNNNEKYIRDVKKIKPELKEKECIANHINLSNYTKREKGRECWEFFNKRLPNEIFFNKICLRGEKGNLIFCINLN